jgi:photosynthetic reaction center cytochrome c subunit
MPNPTVESLLGKRALFVAVFIIVTICLAGSSVWVANFVYREAQGAAEASGAVAPSGVSLAHVNYNVDAKQFISAESYLAMGDYQKEFPETQNVQVLNDLTTAQMVSFMTNQVSAGLGVDCTHCHTLANFAADEWDNPVAMANKATARQHLLMVRDLNTLWLPQLTSLTPQKQPYGAQITCATCHNGVPQPVTWPTGIASQPANLRLPYEPVSVEGIDILNVNGRRDISLDTVQYHQDLMYHMNVSLNVGCTHCHNSRYFPSWEVPAKYYALHMVQMSQFIWQNYGSTMNGSEPSCLMCHQQAVIPPGAAKSAAVMPASLVTTASTATPNP